MLTGMHRIAARRPAALALALALLAGVLPPAQQAAAADLVPSPTVANERIAGADRYGTAVAVAQRLFPSGPVPVVYLASGEDFPDALAAAPIATRRGGVLLFTKRTELPAVTADELTRLNPPEVVLVGGTVAIDAAIEAQVKAALPSVAVRRVAGADRYETAAKLADQGFDPGQASVALLASGQNFPDALAAAAIAAEIGAPVLLVKRDALPAATAAMLRTLKPGTGVVAGGTQVVSDAVLGAIGQHTTAQRVAGADRYETAVKLADRFLPNAKAVLVATGRLYPDGLAAAPLAASLGAPLLFAQSNALPSPTRDELRTRRPTSLVVLGGPAAIAPITVGTLVGYADGRLGLPPPFTHYPAYDSGYHDYGEMFIYIKSAEIAFPGLVRVFSIGKSYQGREIWAAKVSDNVATDEAEPEVMFDALHHAREHLTVEQALYLFRELVEDYGVDSRVTNLVNAREVWIIFAVNPDGWYYDLSIYPYANWRKNRQPAPNGVIGTDPNRNYGYRWGCCGGSSGNPSAWNYRGPEPWSAPEVRAVRDFVLSRRVGGVQQIRTHITLHTNGELILWPYGYTYTDIPSDMRPDDHATFVAMGRAMAALNGYRPQQSSQLYVTDGDQIDWMYGTQRIFSFTFELYPSEQASSRDDFEPPDETIGQQTARNRGALLYLIEMADCPWRAIGKAATYC
ncbi:MAG TPA: M14 family zinc carboxypeptidase [candidate division Zixibacteria bacterium]|nr:M14 family zinc carboxypeptidase [candidate division Zixibacteria bacterium]